MQPATDQIIDCSEFRFRALGIDPGLASTGYALVGARDRGAAAHSWGVVRTDSRHQPEARLGRIFDALVTLLAAWRPHLVAVEDVYVMDRYPRAAIQLGEVRGVVFLAASQAGVSLVRLRPTEVKRVLTGNGRAGKQQVQQAVCRLLETDRPITPDHASDAAALAVIGLSRQGMLRL